MRPDTSQTEPVLPPDRLDAARLEAREHKQPLPRGLQFALAVAAIAGAAGLAFFAGAEPGHPGGPGIWAGFIVVAISTLMALGAVYAVFDLISAVLALGRGPVAPKPAEPLRDTGLVVERAQVPRGIGLATLLLIAAVFWLAYLLVKPLLFSGL